MIMRFGAYISEFSIAIPSDFVVTDREQTHLTTTLNKLVNGKGLLLITGWCQLVFHIDPAIYGAMFNDDWQLRSF